MTTKEIIQTAFIDSVKHINNFNFNTLAAAEAQVEKGLYAVLDKTPWVNDESRKTLDDWFGTVRKGRLHVKGILDEQLKTFETITTAL